MALILWGYLKYWRHSTVFFGTRSFEGDIDFSDNMSDIGSDADDEVCESSGM